MILGYLGEITIRCIINSLKYLPKNLFPYICGGGFKNKFLKKGLNFILENPLLILNL